MYATKQESPLANHPPEPQTELPRGDPGGAAHLAYGLKEQWLHNSVQVVSSHEPQILLQQSEKRPRPWQ